MNNTDEEKSLNPDEVELTREDDVPDKDKNSSEMALTDANHEQISNISGDDFGYIIPKETYKQHHDKRNVRRRRRHRVSVGVPPTEDEASMEGYIFAKKPHYKKRRKHHHHHHSSKKRKKTLIIVLSVLLSLILVAGSAFFIMREIGRGRMHDYSDIDIVPPTEQEIPMDIYDKGRVIHYGGKSYVLNENLVSITFIGADNGMENVENRRMSDAIYIITVDTETGKVKILGVSRDTMTDVTRYSSEGRLIDTSRMQISYSYSYHNDQVTGGMNTNSSLSKLFFGLPLKNYFAINLEALNDLNETVGGVTLTSSMTFESPLGRTINEGDTVTLHGREAERYVRSRDMTKLDSNNARMQRQQQYIRAFLASIVPAVKKDISTISSLYNVVKVNSDSNLNLTDITYLASEVLPKLRSANDIQYVTLSGELTAGEHPELNVSNDQAIRTMLDVFYLPET